jgi:hypothetical protein
MKLKENEKFDDFNAFDDDLVSKNEFRVVEAFGHSSIGYLKGSKQQQYCIIVYTTKLVISKLKHLLNMLKIEIKYEINVKKERIFTSSMYKLNFF